MKKRCILWLIQTAFSFITKKFFTLYVWLLLTIQVYLRYSCCLARTYTFHPYAWGLYPSICTVSVVPALQLSLAFPLSHSCCSNVKNNRFDFTCKLYTENLVLEELPQNLKMRVCENSVDFTELYSKHITYWKVKSNFRFYCMIW